MLVKKEQRTKQQNEALHLYFRHLAEALNDAGLDMRLVLRPTISILWNDKTVKEYLWRPIQKVQTTKASTTELDTREMGEVFKTLHDNLAENFGLDVPFPSEEELRFTKL